MVLSGRQSPDHSRKGQKMDNKKGLSGTVMAISVLAGTVLGTVAGLLLAPQAGKATREKLRKTYDEISDQMNGLVGKANDEIPVIVSRVSSEIRGLPDETRKGLQALKEDTLRTIGKATDQGKAVLEGVRAMTETSMEEGKRRFQEEKERITRKQ